VCVCVVKYELVCDLSKWRPVVPFAVVVSCSPNQAFHKSADRFARIVFRGFGTSWCTSGLLYIAVSVLVLVVVLLLYCEGIAPEIEHLDSISRDLW
jgi:hypothetical protein